MRFLSLDISSYEFFYVFDGNYDKKEEEEVQEQEQEAGKENRLATQ